jgi:hypothetical protein
VIFGALTIAAALALWAGGFYSLFVVIRDRWAGPRGSRRDRHVKLEVQKSCAKLAKKSVQNL